MCLISVEISSFAFNIGSVTSHTERTEVFLLCDILFFCFPCLCVRGSVLVLFVFLFLLFLFKFGALYVRTYLMFRTSSFII